MKDSSLGNAFIWCIVLTLLLPFFYAAAAIPIVWIVFFIFIYPKETGGYGTRHPKYMDLYIIYYKGVYRYDFNTHELIGEVDYETGKLKDKTPDQIREEWAEKDKR